MGLITLAVGAMNKSKMIVSHRDPALNFNKQFTGLNTMNREQLNKHWKEIKAFKNGAEIECRDSNGEWFGIRGPCFDASEYRVKPAPNGSDKVRELLKGGLPVLCGVSDASQNIADIRAIEVQAANLYLIDQIHESGSYPFKGSLGWRYASPVDMSKIAGCGYE